MPIIVPRLLTAMIYSEDEISIYEAREGDEREEELKPRFIIFNNVDSIKGKRMS